MLRTFSEYFTNFTNILRMFLEDVTSILRIFRTFNESSCYFVCVSNRFACVSESSLKFLRILQIVWTLVDDLRKNSECYSPKLSTPRINTCNVPRTCSNMGKSRLLFKFHMTLDCDDIECDSCQDKNLSRGENIFPWKVIEIQGKIHTHWIDMKKICTMAVKTRSDD